MEYMNAHPWVGPLIWVGIGILFGYLYVFQTKKRENITLPRLFVWTLACSVAGVYCLGLYLKAVVFGLDGPDK